MATNINPKGNKPILATPATDLSTADTLYWLYDQNLQQPSSRLIHLLAIPVAVFSLIGVLWVSPFPYLGFLGNYNGFLNWSSFLIAILIYYYLRIAPKVSYIMLLFLLLCAYGITELITYQTTDGIRTWIVCFTLLAISLCTCIFTATSNDKLNPSQRMKLILAAPLWEILYLTDKPKR